jgi:hypothetical protein
VTPDDIPTAVTELTHTAPPIDKNHNGAPLHLSQGRTVALLAHFWPAIEAHIREQVAQEIEAAMARNLAEYPDIPAMRARRLGLHHAARIARADSDLPA